MTSLFLQFLVRLYPLNFDMSDDLTECSPEVLNNTDDHDPPPPIEEA